MKNPTTIYRYGFIASVGFLLVGVLFSMTHWPAAGMFSVLGGISSSAFYVIFSGAAVVKRGSDIPRHICFGAFVVGQMARGVGLSFGAYFLLIALIAFLVWVTWSVLEALPPSED